MGVGSVLREWWRLAVPYWRSAERWRSGALLATVIGMNLGLVWLNVLFAEWNNVFYDALQHKDLPVFTHQLIRFCFLAAAFIVVAVYQTYLQQMLQIRWRRWLTEDTIARWTRAKAYYRVQLSIPGADNPDQRIADDIDSFIANTLQLGLGLLSSVVTLISFVAMLWGLSGPLTLWGVSIPGYMVWVALAYALLGSWLINRIGRPLIRLNFQQQRFEANFRFSLMRLRENAEGVALYGGEAREVEGLRLRFADILGNWWSIMRRQKGLNGFSSGYDQIAIVFPFVVSAPRYFSGALQLGGMMQISSAFGQVQGALSWFIGAYGALASWKATMDRLSGFEGALEQVAREAGASALVRTEAAGARGVTVADLSLWLPDGRSLVEGVSLTLAPGSRTLVSGPSGCGKSTLFRALGGLWPHGRGRLTIPAGARLLFLPQRPYLPIASLRIAVAYPDPPEKFDDGRLRETLDLCGLAHLAGDLDREEHWGQILSLGEQQRLAFARALLTAPDWLFLDEATAALDEASEAALYRLLLERLPGTAVVSVAHRPALAAFHERHLAFRPTEDGAATPGLSELAPA
jgi:vitamin B12/bleomycin/antimicrobial peptide transport system ATP-binding/permease protein